MKTIEVEFYVSTRYVGSDVKELVSIEVSEEATTQEVENIIEEYHDNWVWENIDSGWNIKE